VHVWYIGWYTTPVGTLSGLSGTLRSFLVIFGTFGTPVAFGTLSIGSVLGTLGIIRVDFWYIWCTMVQLTFWYTGWYTKRFFVTAGSFWSFSVRLLVFTFGTPVAFGTLKMGSVFSTLGIIPSEFWYICATFVHFTLYKL